MNFIMKNCYNSVADSSKFQTKTHALKTVYETADLSKICLILTNYYNTKTRELTRITRFKH